MEFNLKASIKNFLDKQSKLKPIATGLEPFVVRDSGIKAVVFDIYGTLLISSSGDIDQANLQNENVEQALQAAGYNLHPEANKHEALSFFLEQLPLVVASHQKVLREQGHPFPDVDIVAVWADLLAIAIERSFLQDNNGSLYELIFVFEILSNKVYPMPDMHELLTTLQAKQFPLGIVSNAQFYTPIIMNYYLNNQFSTSEHIEMFTPELCAFSYKELRAKPDVKLFDVIVPSLRQLHGILPEETLFVGNDMLKDIYTANLAGMKTALFAGDKRSLRLREDDDRTKNLRPDYVVTNLKQIEDLLA